MKVRDSNYELMRIISMFLIVIWHIIVHAGLIYNTSGIIKDLLQLILISIVIHVNSFVLITGYFQYNKDFSLKKFFKTFLPSWFYKIIIPFTLLFLGIITFGKWEIIQIISPIGYSYWFIIVYLLLYLLSPYLNIVIKKLNKYQHKNLIILLFILFSVLPFITNQSYGANNGQNIIQFIFLYFIGAYLHKYPIKKAYNLKILIFIFISCILANYGLYFIENEFTNTNNSMLKYTKDCIETSLLAYSNPIVVIQSIAYFLFFGCLQFKNKIINSISPLVFGVYLIHDNRYIRQILYSDIFHLNNNQLQNSLTLFPYILLTALIIFVICLAIEKTRQSLSKKICNTNTITKFTTIFYKILPIKLP